MKKYKINLVTMSDCQNFVKAVSLLSGSVVLKDDKGYCVNGKSLLGAIATTEWDNLYCFSDNEIYDKIAQWVAD